MMDQTAPWTTDRAGNDIWYNGDAQKSKDQSKILDD
jgi:hypothetical protein